MFPSQTQAHPRTGHAADVNWFKKDDPGDAAGLLGLEDASSTGNWTRAAASSLRALSGLASETGRVESFFKRLFS